MDGSFPKKKREALRSGLFREAYCNGFYWVFGNICIGLGEELLYVRFFLGLWSDHLDLMKLGGAALQCRPEIVGCLLVCFGKE